MNKPLLSICFFFGCISVSCDKAPKEEPVPVTGITISPTSLTLTEGESGELTVKVLPADAHEFGNERVADPMRLDMDKPGRKEWLQGDRSEWE